MASSEISRRNFLKGSLAGLTISSLPILSGQTAQATTAQSGYDSSHFTVCDMCFNRCGVIARVKNGRVVKLDPNPDFIKSRGMLCARGVAGVAQLYDQDRIKTPLLRVGKRGENKWKSITWDEAFKLSAERFLEIAKKYTRCGVVFSFGADMQTTFGNRLAEAFGSFNTTTQESLCLFSMHRAYLDTFGEIPQADLLNCKYILMPGSNRFESLVTPDSSDLMTAMQAGAKLTIVDPRYTKSAALATDWLKIKPGTDLALALALIHVIITENLYNAAWVEANTFGLEQLAAHVQTCTPAWAEQETEIPATLIYKVARELAAAAPAALVYPGRRTSDYKDSTQIRRGWAILNGLLGNFDQKGGLLVPSSLRLRGTPLNAPWYDDTPSLRLDAKGCILPFKEEASFLPLRDAILKGQPYPAKGWLTFKTNPMQTAPDRQKTLDMINQLDFMVSIDILMSDTAFMSDLILPAHTYLERSDPCQVLAGGPAGACIAWRDPVVPPLYDTKSPFEIFKCLANQLGLAEHFNFTLEQHRATQLASLPKAEQDLAKQSLREKGVYHPAEQKVYGLYPGKTYKTSSKKIDLYSSMYEKKKLDPLPVYTKPTAISQTALRLVAGRTALITQSSSQNNALLAEFVPTNTLHVHPETAQALKLQVGELIEITSPVGKQQLKLELADHIQKNTVYMHTGFGSLSPGLSRVYKNGACIAVLMPDAWDAISGNAAHHEGLVQLKLAGQGGKA